MLKVILLFIGKNVRAPYVGAAKKLFNYPLFSFRFLSRRWKVIIGSIPICPSIYGANAHGRTLLLTFAHTLLAKREVNRKLRVI